MFRWILNLFGRKPEKQVDEPVITAGPTPAPVPEYKPEPVVTPPAPAEPVKPTYAEPAAPAAPPAAPAPVEPAAPPAEPTVSPPEDTEEEKKPEF